jgi:hypothetical protein
MFDVVFLGRAFQMYECFIWMIFCCAYRDPFDLNRFDFGGLFLILVECFQKTPKSK